MGSGAAAGSYDFESPSVGRICFQFRCICPAVPVNPAIRASAAVQRWDAMELDRSPRPRAGAQALSGPPLASGTL